MKALAVMFFLLGCIALYSFSSETEPNETKAEAVATNFVLYRNAVNTHAISNRLSTGSVAVVSLALPSGWAALRTWQNRIVGGRLYVWGPCSAQEAEAVLDVVHDSLAVGVNRNGRLENRKLCRVGALPGFIPEGSIVSVIEQPS